MAAPNWMDVQAVLSGGTAAPGSGPAPVRARDPELEARILADLNAPQREAVLHAEGPMLILAGAGSGKTRVITRRVAWLVASARAEPYEVLAITFTNKAAREMRERVERLLPESGAWIATFHATCARILRRDIHRLPGFTRDFSIYDSQDRNALLKRIVRDLGFDPQRFRPAALAARIGDEKSRSSARAPDVRGIEDQVFVQVRDRYAATLREANALDFDDLQAKTLELFEAHPDVRDAYAGRFRYVMVDEYQDTNEIQYRLTRHLASRHRNLAVCGDPDQSIYGWRGADVRNILDFERDFGGEPDGVHVVKLEQNYRSTDCILAAAQGLIRHNRRRLEKGLWTERKAEHRVRVLECADENDEANEVAAQIHALVARGVRPDGIAVFYRVNFMQRALERALRLAGIAYQVVGGVEFYERREVRDLVAYLRLMVNPRDDLACARVLNVPARGVGEKSLSDLAAAAAARGLSLLEAARSEELRATLRGKARAGVEAFAGLLERLAPLAAGSASTALARLVAEIDYFGWLSATSAGEPAGTREENVEELLTHAETYDRASPAGGLSGFLEEVALVSDVDAWDERAPRVTLMTLHSSKGLEFPAVFLAGLEEGLLPHALALAEAEDEDAAVEEERRLLYVGMTRARDELFLTHARLRLHFGETSLRSPSRFLQEIPPSAVEGLEEPGASGGERAPSALGDWQAPPEVELAVGDRVEHDHFGRGRVERLQGAGANARITVDFAGVGTKVLLAQYARLRRVAR